jgi:pimeloyl-ACP methyl ester carboxylesterase
MRPFALRTPLSEIADLRRRLAASRFPPSPIGDAADESGMSLTRLGSVVERWRDGFDWGDVEDGLAATPQFEADVDGQRLHFAHLRAADPAVTERIAVVVFHGWPYSFVEMLPMARLLAADPVVVSPGRVIGFDVIVVSLPGYGHSAALDNRPFTGPVVARLMHTLMTEVLGYQRYITYGEDVGSTTSDWLAALYPESVLGLFATHAAFPPPSRQNQLSQDESSWVSRHEQDWARASAYAGLQSTRPETLAVALSDSPAGLAAWMIEKLLSWSGDGSWWSDDDLLTTVSLYWFTNSIGSSFQPYRDHRLQPELPLVHVPVAVSVQTGERGLPRSYAARTYTDIRRWRDLDVGAHFTAWQAPRAVTADMRSFAASLV